MRNDAFNKLAIINKDSSFSALITMQPRLPFGVSNDNGKIFNEITNSVNEITWGGNLRISPLLGTNFGFTYYESLYDRVLDPQVVNTITGGDEDSTAAFTLSDYDTYSGDAFFGKNISNSTDSEIKNMYASNATSSIFNSVKSFRRVRGFNFSTVIKNIVLQAEYGELLNDMNLFYFGRDAKAFVINTFTQFDNLNFLLLYRNYDLGYDNPYQRSFSNYQRYKTSIFEDSFWLEDPVYGFLYSGSSQPQAEEGLYFTTRYQFHRSAVMYMNWDVWNRKADNAKYYRTVVSIDLRPVFNYRINIRQKWQARGEQNIFHPSPFFSRETRIRARLRLSQYNQLELLFSNGHTTFSPRPRLTGNPFGGSMVVGDIGTPDRSYGFSLDYNIDKNMKIKIGTIFINGFLWYFEDTDFRVFSTDGSMVHHWASINYKPIKSLKINFKVSLGNQLSSTTIDEVQSYYGVWYTNPEVNNKNIDYKIQIDYAI